MLCSNPVFFDLDSACTGSPGTFSGAFVTESKSGIILINLGQKTGITLPAYMGTQSVLIYDNAEGSLGCTTTHTILPSTYPKCQLGRSSFGPDNTIFDQYLIQTIRPPYFPPSTPGPAPAYTALQTPILINPIYYPQSIYPGFIDFELPQYPAYAFDIPNLINTTLMPSDIIGSEILHII